MMFQEILEERIKENQSGNNWIVCTEGSDLPECNTDSQEEISASEDRAVIYALTGALMFIFALVIGFILLSTRSNKLAEDDSKDFSGFVPPPPSISSSDYQINKEEE